MSKFKRIKKVRLSVHAKQRYEERTDIHRSCYEEVALLAYNKGVAHSNLTANDLVKYPHAEKELRPGRRGVVKRYYKGGIYIFDVFTHRLLTVYVLRVNGLAKKELEQIEERKKRNRSRR